MAWWTYPVLVLAGIGGGITGSVAGLASIVSYPVLLAVGLAPVTANVSNTVALVFSAVGAASGSAVELSGQRQTLRPMLAAALAGGIVGGVLLLTTPAHAFKDLAPWLIAGASVAIMLPRRRLAAVHSRHHRAAQLAGTFLISVYGGYFGAAAGVLMLALLLAMTEESMARASAAKNVIMGVANAVAAVAFIVFGPVHWLAVLPLAAGFLLGGRLGPVVVRSVPATPLRVVIALAGIGLAIVLARPIYF